nr:hypothetical protein [uncultured Brumimicrobium sp.]
MKKIKIVLLGIGILAVSSVFAQEQKAVEKPKMKKEQRMEKLAEELDLSEEQREQVDKIHKNHVLESRKIKNNSEMTEDAKKEALKKLRLDKKAQMAEVLTEEQRQKLEEMKKERKEKRVEQKKVERHSIKKEKRNIQPVEK